MTLLTSSQLVGLRPPQTPQKLAVYVSKGWELEMAQATPPLGSPIWNGGALGPAGRRTQQGEPGWGPAPRAGLRGCLVAAGHLGLAVSVLTDPHPGTSPWSSHHGAALLNLDRL